MVINGPNIEAQSSSSAMPQPVLTISQLLMYNSLVRRRKNQATSTIRHNQERETPLPIYLGVMVHTKTRKCELVDTLHELGLSVSYDRVMDISTELGNKICSHYQREKLSVLLSSNVVFSQLLQLTTFTIIPALLVHMMHSMELGTPCFSTRTVTVVELRGLLPLHMVILLPPIERLHACLRPTLASLLLL